MDAITPISEKDVRKWLQPGETVLWQHIVDPPQVSNPKAFFANRPILTWILLIAFYAVLFGLLAYNIKDVAEPNWSLAGAVTLGGLFGVVTGLLQRRFNSRSEPSHSYDYQNGVITDRRVWLFNHHDDKLAELTTTDIDSADVDYKNGARVLRITSPHHGNLVLAGSTKCMEAAFIINNRMSFV